MTDGKYELHIDTFTEERSHTHTHNLTAIAAQRDAQCPSFTSDPPFSLLVRKWLIRWIKVYRIELIGGTVRGCPRAVLSVSTKRANERRLPAFSLSVELPPFAPVVCRPSQPRNHTVRARPPSQRHPIGHPASQPTNQPANQPVSQLTSQPTNQSASPSSMQVNCPGSLPGPCEPSSPVSHQRSLL